MYTDAGDAKPMLFSLARVYSADDGSPCADINLSSCCRDRCGHRCVAVGVPAKVIGQSRRRKPALLMGQDFLKEVWHGSDI